MKILLIGSGGREHSLAKKIAASPRLKKLYCAPGNPGTAQVAKNLPISELEIDKLLNFAKDNNIDFTFVGPEAPLVAGIVDKFNQANLCIIGPSQQGAQLEGSKEWAKAFLTKYSVPTASYEVFSDFDTAIEYIKNRNLFPIVIKADGLAAGKGVTVADNLQMAEDALKTCFLDKAFGSAGESVVIEDFLVGEEASILAFTDGNTVIPMASAQDHKAVYEGDKGPNTGGMGAYSPAPIVTANVEKKVLETILKPVVAGFKKEGILYKGILYAGLMINNEEPSVVEFNVRFGDPETQVVLPRLKNDLVDIFEAIRDQKLNELKLDWTEEPAICVVLASKGYPGNYEKGKIITGLDTIKENNKLQVIHAGTKLEADKTLVTKGGRVLGVVSQGKDLPTAIDTAYNTITQIHYDGLYFRRDIAKKALKRVITTYD